MSLRVVLVGYGRMGREIEALCSAHDCEVVERLDIHNNVGGQGIDSARLPAVDVAIEFSTPSATVENLPRLASAGINAVIGTTGWNDHQDQMKQVVANAGIGVVVAANFSLGVNLFEGIVGRAAAWVRPAERIRGLDTRNPSHGETGCAVRHSAGARAQDARGWIRSTGRRVLGRGSDRCQGTHTVGFDGPFETIHADAHRAGSCNLRTRRPGGGPMGTRQARLVHDA